MATLETLRDRLRLELHDNPVGFDAEAVGDDLLDRFDLPVRLIKEDSASVFIDGSAVEEGVDYFLDSYNGVLSLTTPLASGTVLSVEGAHYEVFLDSELDQFIATAFLQHTHGRYGTTGDPLTYEELPGVEEYLVVILAFIQALWVLASEAGRNIDIIVPDGVNIPESQRFQQIMALIGVWQERYNTFSMQLNVGLGRIEMYTLRRISRTTNRLVPLYVPQEYDDTSFPTRILAPIDQGL
jgi:hypothetical protein